MEGRDHITVEGVSGLMGEIRERHEALDASFR